MKKVLTILLFITFTISANAQLIHTKGKMGVGVRGGIGWIKSNHAYNLGLMYHYYTGNKTGILVEVDREKAEFEYSNFTNHFLVGAGFEYAVWKPCKWLYMNLNFCGNFGYDEWNCKIMDWKEKHFIGGANGGFALEAYPWHFLSVMLKARQFLLFGKEMNYLKPDFSLGLKYNW